MTSPNNAPQWQGQPGPNQQGMNQPGPNQPGPNQYAQQGQPPFANYPQQGQYPQPGPYQMGPQPAGFLGSMAHVIVARPTITVASLIGMIGSLLAIIGCFLPFFTYSYKGYGSSYSVSFSYLGSGMGTGKPYYGIFVLLLMVATIVFFLFPKKEFSVTTVALSTTALLFPLYELITRSSGYSLGVGFVFILIGALAALFCAAVQMLAVNKDMIVVPPTPYASAPYGMPAPGQGQMPGYAAPNQPNQFGQYPQQNGQGGPNGPQQMPPQGQQYPGPMGPRN